MRPGSSPATRTSDLPGRIDQPVHLYGHGVQPISTSQSQSDSQHSWSPLLTEHAAIPPAPLDSLLDRPKTSATADRKPLTDRLLSSRVTGSKQSTVYQLEDEFGKRYREYITLNRWMDNRLAVFNQLQTELVTVADKSKAQEQVIFRVVVEEQRLKDDREYQENAEKLEECCAALMMIKARLASAVKAHK
ncbi:hypothetical protein PSACC_00795 [Paramicrosporidium saccamoebae]|uniref:OCEL domain-containing protein n=1 Tax=Paramicrosporidium saccamoebae TaxID=1246581 RepID=A0A2H9TNR6_9FUNG|nr:hypothetical protein PSACC_00795 [Paramicrosporidium saccamoebae]